MSCRWNASGCQPAPGRAGLGEPWVAFLLPRPVPSSGWRCEPQGRGLRVTLSISRLLTIQDYGEEKVNPWIETHPELVSECRLSCAPFLLEVTELAVWVLVSCLCLGSLGTCPSVPWVRKASGLKATQTLALFLWPLASCACLPAGTFYSCSGPSCQPPTPSGLCPCCLACSPSPHVTHSYSSSDAPLRHCCLGEPLLVCKDGFSGCIGHCH